MAGLGRFAGVGRRFEWRGERDGVTFIDDYGHLPGEVARRGWPRPGRAAGGGWSPSSSPTATPAPRRSGAFADAFDDADVVVVTGIYPSGEAPIPGVTGRLVADAVAAAHPDLPLRYCEELDDLLALLAGPAGAR